MNTCQRRMGYARTPSWIFVAAITLILPLCQCRHTIEYDSRNPFAVQAEDEIQRTSENNRISQEEMDLETSKYAKKLMNYLKGTRSPQAPEFTTFVNQGFELESLERLGTLLDVTTSASLAEKRAWVNIVEPTLVFRHESEQDKPAQ